MVSLYKHAAEEGLLAMEKLNLTILRPAIVYGEADVNGIMPRVVCAAVYKYEHEIMKFLWDKSTRINTVHVHDMVRAMWHVAELTPEKAIYNICDKGDTGKVQTFSLSFSDLVIFRIEI